MIDSYGRKITYLRLSVTELCNLRCRYCMPAEGICKHSHAETLTEDEMIQAVEVAAELGGIASLAGAMIVLTGILGNLSASALCRIAGLHDPVARGVAIGTGAHAVGTARALQMGRVEGAVSSLSIAVAGVLTAIICPILANFLV